MTKHMNTCADEYILVEQFKHMKRCAHKYILVEQWDSLSLIVDKNYDFS